MSGPSLLGLVGAELTAGTAKPTVLKPTGAVTLPDGGAGPHRRRRDQARRRRALPAGRRVGLQAFNAAAEIVRANAELIAAGGTARDDLVLISFYGATMPLVPIVALIGR